MIKMEKTHQGFSLIELVVAMTVVVLTTTVGIPSLKHMNNSSRLTSKANEFVSSLQLARSETLKRNVKVTMCKSSDGETCQKDNNNIDWSDGWIVFVDCNDNQTVDAPPVTCLNGETLVDKQGKPIAESVLQVGDSFAGGFSIVPSESFDSHVTYFPPGYSHGFGSLTLCPVSGNEWRQIVIASSGKIQVKSSNKDAGAQNPCT